MLPRRRASLRGLLPGEVGCPQRGREPGPSRCVLCSPHPCRLQFCRAGSRGGGAAFLFPPCGSCLSLREPVKCQGEEIQTKKEREGEQRRGPTPPSLSREGKEKNSPQDVEADQRSGGCRSGGRAPGTAVLPVALRASGPRAAGRRDSEGLPVSCQLTQRAGAPAARSPAGGRAHARPQRGAARGGISAAPEQQQRQQRPETELETPPPPAAPAHPGGGRGGEALPPRPLQSPPRLLLLLLHLLLTEPLWLSEPFCPALASTGSRSQKAPTGPGPSAGAGAEQGA